MSLQINSSLICFYFKRKFSQSYQESHGLSFFLSFFLLHIINFYFTPFLTFLAFTYPLLPLPLLFFIIFPPLFYLLNFLSLPLLRLFFWFLFISFLFLPFRIFLAFHSFPISSHLCVSVILFSDALNFLIPTSPLSLSLSLSLPLFYFLFRSIWLFSFFCFYN